MMVTHKNSSGAAVQIWEEMETENTLDTSFDVFGLLAIYEIEM